MVKRCSICAHPSCPEINQQLHAGVNYRDLAAKFGISPSALSRHVKHMQHQRQIRIRRNDEAFQAHLLEKLELLDTRLDRLFNSALDFHALNVSLGCIRESLRLISILERCRVSPHDHP